MDAGPQARPLRFLAFLTQCLCQLHMGLIQVVAADHQVEQARSLLLSISAQAMASQALLWVGVALSQPGLQRSQQGQLHTEVAGAHALQVHVQHTDVIHGLHLLHGGLARFPRNSAFSVKAPAAVSRLIIFLVTK